MCLQIISLNSSFTVLIIIYFQCLSLYTKCDTVSALNVNVVRRDASDETNEDIFKECGGLLREKNFGVITTPNFPDPFPVPIYCRWVIEAKPGKVIALYLTQFFLREGLKATEYAFFADNSLSVGKKYLGTISFDDETTFIITNQPLLVLELEVYDAFNIHMRVMDYFLDVYGFNITYEIVPKSDSLVPKRRTDTCSVFKCSFTGHCFVNETFDRYFCSCFAGFFGKECEFGPKCDSLQAKNDCQNGGMCRYSKGSSATICKCPPNYEGNNCEIPKLITTQKCKKKIDCSIDCKRNRNHSSDACDCRKHSQITEDYAFDCNQKGQMRYLVAIKVYDSNVDLQHLDRPRYLEIKSGLEFTISSLLKPYLYSEDIHLSILEFKPGAVVTFHFFHFDDDDFTLKRVFQEALKHGRLGRYVVDKTFLQFEKEPVVNIVHLKANEEMPILENKELKIDCIILGSQSIEVYWFKDGSLINVNRSFERSISQAIHARNEKGYFVAYLRIEKVTVLDGGIFTCQVSEWGFTANTSIAISVQTSPKPIITPLTQTVFESDTVIVVCFATEDLINRKFGYNWLKNGDILNPSEEQEIVEDIFPTGSRIIFKASKNVVYTCLVSSPLGTISKTSVITVLPNRNSTDVSSMCPKQLYEEVEWQSTAINAEDIQLCPTNFKGEVKRKCILINGSNASWDEPDFSNCIAKQFKYVKLQFTKLKLGYETSKESIILNNLKLYLNGHKLKHCEGEAIVQFLRTVLDYFQKAKANTNEIRLSSEVSLDIISTLLDQPDSVKKHSIISILHELIVEFSLLRSKSGKNSVLRLTRNNFVVEIVKISGEDKSLNFPLKYSSEMLKKRKLDKQQMNTINHLPIWLTDSVFVNFSPMIPLNSSTMTADAQNYSPDCVVTVFYKNLAVFLPKRFLIRRQIPETSFQIHSRLLTVALFYNPNQLISTANGPKITAFLNHHNITEYPQHPWRVACGVADFGERIGFHTHQCETKIVHSSSSVTICVCNVTGTYGVILTTQVKRLNEVSKHNHDLTGIVGCAICTLFVLLSLVILTAESKCSMNAIRSLKIQVCIAVIGANFSFIATLYPMVPTLQNHMYSLFLFFQIAVFSLQICFCAIIYSQIAHVSYTSLQHPESKLTFLGWVIPVSVEGATIAAQAVRGFPSNQWSLQYGTTYFYGTLITTAFLFTFHLFLYITIRVEFIRRRKVETLENISRIKAATAILNQSLVINCVFESALITTIAYINIRTELFKQLFVATYVALGLFILISYSFCIYHDSKLSVVCDEPDVDKDQKSDIVYEMNHLQLTNASPPPVANHTFH